MTKRFQIEIEPMWSIITEVKEKINNVMEGMSRSSIDFTSIVASELLENAIKYGVSREQIPQVSFEFELDEDSVSIKVRNGVSHGENLDQFKDMMNKIKTTENRKNLYLERLQEIMDNPIQHGSHLGMYRIVSESEFDLDYRLDFNVLEIIATKQFLEDYNGN